MTDLQSVIQLRYVNKCPTKTLLIYGVPQRSLREFSQDNRRYGFVNLPPDEHRLRDQEIVGMDEINNQASEDQEAEMNEMFNQSILDVGGEQIGRLSITHQSNDLGGSTEASSVSS